MVEDARLNVSIPETKTGIPSFGERTQIANAISELRSPRSSFETRPELRTPSSLIPWASYTPAL